MVLQKRKVHLPDHELVDIPGQVDDLPFDQRINRLLKSGMFNCFIFIVKESNSSTLRGKSLEAMQRGYSSDFGCQGNIEVLRSVDGVEPSILIS